MRWTSRHACAGLLSLAGDTRYVYVHFFFFRRNKLNCISCPGLASGLAPLLSSGQNIFQPGGPRGGTRDVYVHRFPGRRPNCRTQHCSCECGVARMGLTPTKRPSSRRHAHCVSTACSSRLDGLPLPCAHDRASWRGTRSKSYFPACSFFPVSPDSLLRADRGRAMQIKSQMYS